MLHSEIFYAFLITALSLSLVSTVLSRFKIPTIVGFILTGVLIGPSSLNWIQSLPAAQTISELGILFLMFSLGLELSLAHLRKMLVPFFKLGALQFFGTLLVATLLFQFGFALTGSQSLLLGTCLALSSTAIVLKLLQEKREMETPYGRVTLVILLFQDLMALPAMAMIPFLDAATTGQNTLSLGWLQTLGLVALFLVACFFIGRQMIPRLFEEVTRAKSREVFFFALISVTFVIAFLAEKVGLSMSLGAFVAGVMISESPFSKQALAELGPLRDIFLGFFFASVGMMLDLGFVLEHFHQLIWLIPLLFIIKFSVLYLVVRFESRSHGVSFASALALSQIGEFSFVLAASAYTLKLLNPEQFQFFLVLAITSLVLTPYLLSFGIQGSAHSSWPELIKVLGKSPSLTRNSEALISESGGTQAQELTLAGSSFLARKTVVLGLGHAGQVALDAFTLQGIPCLGVDLNWDNVRAVKSKSIPALYGDCTRPEVLESAGVRDAFLVIISVSGKQMTSQILSLVRHINPSAKIIARVHYYLDTQDLPPHSADEIVISEAETAQSILARALDCYHLTGV